MSREGTEVAVTCPPAVESIVELGAAKLVVLERLKNSARNERTLSRVRLMFLKT